MGSAALEAHGTLGQANGSTASFQQYGVPQVVGEARVGAIHPSPESQEANPGLKCPIGIFWPWER